jgi:hypothetical protein
MAFEKENIHFFPSFSHGLLLVGSPLFCLKGKGVVEEREEGREIVDISTDVLIFLQVYLLAFLSVYFLGICAHTPCKNCLPVMKCNVEIPQLLADRSVVLCGTKQYFMCLTDVK